MSYDGTLALKSPYLRGKINGTSDMLHAQIDNPDNPVPYHRGLPCPHPRNTDPLALTIAKSVHQVVDPAATILFGSRAHGDHTEPTSDVDILIITEEPVSGTRESLAERNGKNLVAKLYGSDIKTHLV